MSVDMIARALAMKSGGGETIIASFISVFLMNCKIGKKILHTLQNFYNKE